MVGRTPGNIIAIRPMKDGVIADFESTEKMLDYFIKEGRTTGNMWVRPRIVIGVAFGDHAGGKEGPFGMRPTVRAHPKCIWWMRRWPPRSGQDCPSLNRPENMIVDIGGGTTDVAVISLAGIVYSRSVRIAGNEMDEAIISVIKKKYNLLIGERTLCNSENRNSARPSPWMRKSPWKIKGRNLMEGIPKTIVITDSEIRDALSDTVAVIVNTVHEALEKTPPELSADILDRGIVLTGGGCVVEKAGCSFA